MKQTTIIISLGGSLISTKRGIDINFLRKFKKFILKNTKKHRFVIVAGGGVLCRKYQEAAERLGDPEDRDLDWIGIRATKINAELLRSIFGSHAYEKIIHNPTEAVDTKKKIIIGSGWLPGFSSDKDAVLLAENFGAKLVVNLSNIDYVYTKDPKKHRDAKRIEEISWPEFKKIVGSKWEPGVNLPFDPIASRLAEKNGIQVVVLNGKKLDNLKKFLAGKKFKGTLIG